MLVKVSRSADRHCLRRDVGMGSRSEKDFCNADHKLNYPNPWNVEIKFHQTATSTEHVGARLFSS